MATNPNPSRISDALWRLWTEFDAFEPSAVLGGIVTEKPGYHSWRSRLPADDYSVEDLAADRRGSASKASAIDLTLPDAAMRKYTGRLDTAARSRDPRLYSSTGPVLREFIGTKDSRTVYCYVLVGGRPLGVGADAGPDPGRDTSHLWHIHLSIIRQFCEDWPALDGVLSVLKGETLAAWRARAGGNDVGELVGDQAKQLAATTERVRALVQLVEEITTGWSANPTGKEQMPAVLALKAATTVGPALTAIQEHLVVLGQAVTELAARPAVVISDEQLEKVLRKVLGMAPAPTPQEG